MGGTPDLQSPPTTRLSRSEGGTRERRLGRGHGEGAPPPLGGRGTQEEEAQAIMNHIVNLMKGSVHEDDFFIVHDDLVLMTAKETIQWMK